MSKLNCIDKKRRFQSFLIYIFIAAFVLSGCAAKSSVDLDSAANADSQSNIAQQTADYSSNDTVPEERPIAMAADRKTETKTAESAASQNYAEEKEYTESEPRIFFVKPSDSKLGRVLGIDFSMMPQGKSRLTVTTSKEVKYDLDRINSKKLSLNIYDSKIGNDVLLKYIDTTEFQTPVETITPEFDKNDNRVSLNIVMRDVVPYYLKQTDDSLILDFDRTETKVPEKRITPLNLVEAETKNLSGVREQNRNAAPLSSRSQAEIQAFAPSVSKKYTGEPLYLDFVNADVTHILRLINEVSKENIIWDPAIKGKKVSMILNDVPWDEALELILKNNELAKRYVGQNIVWITTKQKMAQILADEEAEEKRMEQKLELERQKLEEQMRRSVDEAPLITVPLPVDFAKAGEIKDHIVLTKRGKLSIDARTNTIIMTDTETSIEEAKKILMQFDTPVKQIMIEARIVEATDNFSRDLGIKWNIATSAYKSNTSTVTGPDFLPLGAPGERVYGGNFSTNAPTEDWGNIGLTFARLTSDGLGSLTLDASLALAESDGTAKTLSAPKVLAQEGAAATISSGEIVYIEPSENVAGEEFPAELSLTVTPDSVSFNDYITLNVSVSDDQRITDLRKTTKTINTTLMVKSGETIVIGGILKENKGEDEGGLPVLKDIPGMGWLFKAKTKRYSKSELLIFLTPTVVPSPVKQF